MSKVLIVAIVAFIAYGIVSEICSVFKEKYQHEELDKTKSKGGTKECQNKKEF